MARLTTAFVATTLVLLLAACANQATPAAPAVTVAPAATTATPDEVALEFVTALGSWKETTLRRIAIPGDATELRLASSKSQWNRWTQDRIGPQTGVEVVELTVDGDRATVLMRSQHERDTTEATLSMVRMDGTWRVEAWDSYRP